ncbi:MAG: prepilin-type N-terminal cleavage/methylation domain-containing protein [Candidatus Staskawiczbacteria bacterium]|nr:prepilin-type N-terminal cleavage/methylation domain-containing protein [Candidatus Staskawiczbacteria bacterium]
MNKSKGFTIIELIVVIAIIAVLAAIVLVNVTGYINKGKDAAAQGNLASLITNGATWFAGDTTPVNAKPGTYNGFITGTGTGAAGYVSVYNALVAAGYTVTATCNVAACADPSTNWCAQVTLKSSTNTYCVDSTGNKLSKASGTCLVATGTCL